MMIEAQLVSSLNELHTKYLVIRDWPAAQRNGWLGDMTAPDCTAGGMVFLRNLRGVLERLAGTEVETEAAALLAALEDIRTGEAKWDTVDTEFAALIAAVE
jgi:hypothetical protein